MPDSGLKTRAHNTCVNKHKTDIKTHQNHRYNTISIFRNIFFPCNTTVVHLFFIKYIKRFLGNSKIFAILFTPCMAIDSSQKRFVMNMQLRQYFARTKPLLTEKSQILLKLKNAKCFEKKHNFTQNLASKIPNWQPCALID